LYACIVQNTIATQVDCVVVTHAGYINIDAILSLVINYSLPPYQCMLVYAAKLSDTECMATTTSLFKL